MDWFTAHGFTHHDIHSSGHADAATLREYADTLDPKTIIPIHTFNKKDYKNLFKQNIRELDDGEVLTV